MSFGWLVRTPLRLGIAAILLVDIAVFGVDLFLLSNRSTTTVVDLQDALVDFRQGLDDDATSVTSALAGGAAVTDTDAPPAPEVATIAAAEVPDVAQAPAPTIAAEPAAPSAFGLPAEGVYAYRTHGAETVSLLGARHEYPATSYATVRHTGGCGWEIRSEVIREHVDARAMCSEPGQLLQLGQSREVEFFGTRDGGAFVCSPPQVQHAIGEGEGTRSEGTCDDGKGSTVRLVRTTTGVGQETVGGEVVEVIRLRIEGTLSGRVRGTSLDELTVVAATGLPVRWTRTVDSDADAFGTTIKYQEQTAFDLVSLTPAT